MKSAPATCLLVLTGFSTFFATATAQAVEEPTLERMATCQDSWLDWKNDPTRGQKFADGLHANYAAQRDGGYLVPKAKVTLFGQPLARVYPESVGMGVGFSVAVTSSFDASKKAVEKAIGKKLKCEADSAEVRACEADLGPKKNVTVASNPGDDKFVLIGCFYFYEK
jgi:hypothetical protein